MADSTELQIKPDNDIQLLEESLLNKNKLHTFATNEEWYKETKTRICASLGSPMKFKTLCYPVFGRNKNTALPSF